MTNYMIGQRKCNSGRAEQITTLIAKMVALDTMPTYMVEGKGFRQFMGFIEPDFKVPCHQTIMRRINKMYNKVRGDVEKTLENITDVSITTDVWTSLATESYVTVTAPFYRYKLANADICFGYQCNGRATFGREPGNTS